MAGYYLELGLTLAREPIGFCLARGSSARHEEGGGGEHGCGAPPPPLPSSKNGGADMKQQDTSFQIISSCDLESPSLNSSSVTPANTDLNRI